MADKTLTLSQWDDVALMASMVVLGNETEAVPAADLTVPQVDATLKLLEDIGNWQMYFLVDGEKARNERLTIDLPEGLPFSIDAVGP